MSLFATLRSSSFSTGTIATAVQIYAGDIAQANNPNHHRQQVRFTTDSFVAGLRLASVERVSDALLSSALTEQNSVRGFAANLAAYMERIENLFGLDTDTPRLTRLYETFEASWHDFQANPESEIFRDQIVEHAAALAAGIQSLAVDVISLRTQITDDIEGDILAINRLAQDILEINKSINDAEAQGAAVGDLATRRDEALAALSALVPVTIREAESGQVDVYLKNGPVLVGEGQTARLVFDRAAKTIGVEGSTAVLASDDAGVVLGGGVLSARFALILENTPTTTHTNSLEPETAFLNKLELVLDSLADTLSAAGTPADPTLNSVYQSADTRVGEHNGDIFLLDGPPTDPSRFRLGVHTDLLDGTAVIKTQSVLSATDSENVIFALRQSIRGIDVAGLGLVYRREELSYGGLIEDFTGWVNNRSLGFQSQSALESETYDALRYSLVQKTGVNTDETLLSINALQKNYTANARVIAAVNIMFDSLFAAVR